MSESNIPIFASNEKTELMKTTQERKTISFFIWRFCNFKSSYVTLANYTEKNNQAPKRVHIISNLMFEAPQSLLWASSICLRIFFSMICQSRNNLLGYWIHKSKSRLEDWNAASKLSAKIHRTVSLFSGYTWSYMVTS